MISAFIANGNALREVVELLGHVCLNFTLFHSEFSIIIELLHLFNLDFMVLFLYVTGKILNFLSYTT